MELRKYCGTFRSTDSSDNIAYYVYSPDKKPKAAVQLVHGMCEYLERYEEFIGFLTENGYLVFGHDQLGHGKSVVSSEYLGYFAPSKGWQFLAKDVFKLASLIRRQYGGIPYFIIGHSMGSLVSRAVLAKHSDIYDGAVLLGTINTKTGADAGLAVAKTLCRLKGDMHRSEFLDEAMFGVSNIKIPDPVNDFAWISRDEEVAKAYAADPLCNFHFTASAYADLLMLLAYDSEENWAHKVDDSLPVLISSGSEDPVGNYGKCPAEVFEKLKKSGQKDIELKIYSGARHELLNETNRAEVREDLLRWLDKRAEGAAEKENYNVR